MNGFLRQAAVDRSARHVRRLRLRAPDSTVRLRVQTMLEEALRLATLPGEDQGRLYFFRRLRLPPLDARHVPSEWIARCSRDLLTMGRSAVQATDPRAAHEEAVFVRDFHEPRRLLLARLVQGDAAQEWFWPQATGVARELPRDIRLEQVLDGWHVQADGWAGVARELLPALDPSAARTLLESLGPSTASRWLAPWSDSRRGGTAAWPDVPVPPVRPQTRSLLQQVRLRFDHGDPRVLFFAALAVLESAPSAQQDARLMTLAARVLDPPDAAVVPAPDSRHRLPVTRQPVSQDARRQISNDAPARTASIELQSSGPLESPTSLASRLRLDHGTACAGLYFLLHPLRHLGIEAALDAHPDLVLTHFVARVLVRLAAKGGVDADDPILQPLFEDIGDTFVRPADDPLVMPRTLATLRRLHPSPALSERLWACAVRRWCRRFARLSLGDILRRPGLVRAAPTSIDVTMPMSAVDLRIRRSGLDIDPGYLPWFDRVVHFHYHVEGAS